MSHTTHSEAKAAQRTSHLIALLLIPLVVLPIIYVIYGSVQSRPPGQSGEWTLANFRALWEGDFLGLLRNTIVLIIGVTAVSIVIAVTLAICVTRLNIGLRKLTDTLIVVPAYIPNLVGAIAWSFLLSPNTGYINYALTRLGLPTVNIYSWWGVVAVSALYAIPIAYLYMRPALESIDQSLEEAGSVLGANKITNLKTILLPLIKPAIKSSALVIVVSSLSNFAVVAILGTPAGIDVIALRIVQLTTAGPIDLGRAAVLGIVLAGAAAVGLAATFRGMRAGDFTTIGGKYVSRNLDTPRGVRLLGSAFCWFYITCTVLLPISVLVIGSLQPYISPDLSSGWTLGNYALMAEYPSAITSVVNSVTLSILASVTAAALSLFLGYLIVRGGGRLGSLINQVSNLPLAVPHMVFAVGMIWLWVGVPMGPYGTKWMLLLAYVALYLPYAIRSAVTAFQQIDPSLEEAARISGARPATVLLRISTPLVLPGLVAGATIVLYHTMQEIAASLILYSPGQPVMTVAIWNMSMTGAYPQLFSLSVVYVGITLALVGMMTIITRRFGALSTS